MSLRNEAIEAMTEEELDARLKTIRDQVVAIGALDFEFVDMDSREGWALFKVWFSLGGTDE